jgi:uncharacterized spore protein YtfJ
METMEISTAVNRLEEVFRSMVDHASAKTVYGEPVILQDKTILPVAKIRYGFGRGSGRNADTEHHGGGGGGGLFAKPLGVIEITQSQTRFIPISSGWTLVAAIALGVCMGWLAAPKRVERH